VTRPQDASPSPPSPVLGYQHTLTFNGRGNPEAVFKKTANTMWDTLGVG
jgi:hypothetical protein